MHISLLFIILFKYIPMEKSARSRRGNWKLWVIVYGLLPALAWGQDVWDGISIASGFEGGNGTTAATPYEIKTAAQLAFLAKSVNEGTNYSDRYFSLTEDIDLNGKVWTPIGISQAAPFSASFEGNGHRITGLSVTATGDMPAGLFGWVENKKSTTWTAVHPRISNLQIEGTVRRSESSAGLLAGGVSGTDLANCAVDGAIYDADNATDAGSAVGLLVGTVEFSKIENCLATGSCELSTVTTCGGLVGFTNLAVEITNCCALPTRIKTAGRYNGIFIGHAYGGWWDYFKNNYCPDKIPSNMESIEVKIGAFEDDAGYVYKEEDFPPFIATYTGIDKLNEGAWIRQHLHTSFGTSTASYCKWKEENGKPALSFGEMPDHPGNNWLGAATTAVVSVEEKADVIVDSETNPTNFKVNTAKGLAWIALVSNYRGIFPGVAPKDRNFEGCIVELGADINLKDPPAGQPTGFNTNWIPICADGHDFKGHFEGKNYKITGLTMKTELSDFWKGGMFGGIKGGKIRNLTVEAAISGPFGMAILAEDMEDFEVINCYTKGNIRTSGIVGGLTVSAHDGKFFNCGNQADLFSDSLAHIGGIAAYSEFVIIANSFNTGNITASGRSAEVGGFTNAADFYNGGIWIENCFNTGTIRLSTLSEGAVAGGIMSVAGNYDWIYSCYNTGDIIIEGIGKEVAAGGIVGFALDDNDSPADPPYIPSIQNCFNAGIVSSGGASGGIAGVAFSRRPYPSVPIIDNSLSLATSVTGHEGDGSRIVGGRSTTFPIEFEDNEVYYEALTDRNYAYPGMLVNGKIVTAGKGIHTPHGADWSKNLAGSPVKDWISEAWQTPIREGLMPKLKQVDPASYDEEDTPPTHSRQYLSALVPFQPDVVIPATDPVAPVIRHKVILPEVEGASTDPAAGEYEIEAHSNFVFYIHLDKNYDQSRPIVTTSRGETLIPRFSDGAYVINDITEAITIRIEGIIPNGSPTANAELPAKTAVWSASSVLHIRTERTQPVSVYTGEGKPVKTFCSKGGEETLLLRAGFYLVRIGKDTYKVIL